MKGQRKGQRAIRLTRQWRAVYTEQDDGSIEFVQIEEVHEVDEVAHIEARIEGRRDDPEQRAGTNKRDVQNTFIVGRSWKTST